MIKQRNWLLFIEKFCIYFGQSKDIGSFYCFAQFNTHPIGVIVGGFFYWHFAVQVNATSLPLSSTQLNPANRLEWNCVLLSKRMKLFPYHLIQRQIIISNAKPKHDYSDDTKRNQVIAKQLRYCVPRIFLAWCGYCARPFVFELWPLRLPSYTSSTS